MLTTRVLLSCLLRSYMIGASFTTRGLQGIGITYAMEPGINALYTNPQARRRAYQRYLTDFNTHPFWAPLLVALFLSVEQAIAIKGLPEESVLQIKKTTAYTLSAIGDSVFGGSILACWSLTACTLIITSHLTAAIVLTIFLIIALQLFKIASFIMSFRNGIRILQYLKKLNLINWGDRIKVFNGTLLAVFMWYAWPNSEHGFPWFIAVLGMAACALLAGKFHISRLLLALGATIVAYYLPWIAQWTNTASM